MNTFQIAGVVITLIGLLSTAYGTLLSSRRIATLEERNQPEFREKQYFFEEVKKYETILAENQEVYPRIQSDIATFFQTNDLRIEYYDTVKTFLHVLRKHQSFSQSGFIYMIGCEILQAYSQNIDDDFFLAVLNGEISRLVLCKHKEEVVITNIKRAFRLMLYEKESLENQDLFDSTDLDKFFRHMLHFEEVSKSVYNMISKEDRTLIYTRLYKGDPHLPEPGGSYWIENMEVTME
jgi:hypothetical protein